MLDYALKLTRTPSAVTRNVATGVAIITEREAAGTRMALEASGE